MGAVSGERFLVVQDLRVTAVELDVEGVSVTVVSADGTRNSIRFDEHRADHRVDRARILHGWRDVGTVLTYVRSSSGAALIDDAEQFRTAFDGAFG
jgi:hypothetical protein